MDEKLMLKLYKYVCAEHSKRLIPLGDAERLASSLRKEREELNTIIVPLRLKLYELGVLALDEGL
jgi:hypothetical protein